MDHEIKNAIENKKIIELVYKGHHHTLEPHCYGLSQKGKDAILAYQTEGRSESGAMPGWKFLELNLCENIRILARGFAKTHSKFERGDKRFKKIYAEV